MDQNKDVVTEILENICCCEHKAIVYSQQVRKGISPDIWIFFYFSTLDAFFPQNEFVVHLKMITFLNNLMNIYYFYDDLIEEPETAGQSYIGSIVLCCKTNCISVFYLITSWNSSERI